MDISEPNTMRFRILCIAMYPSEDIENKVTQLRKGILELAILSALFRDTHYGYSLVRQMAVAGVLDLNEGTIYPILSRLAKEGLVQTEWVESKQGPPRKYYTLTDAGRVMCAALAGEFRSLVRLVEAAGQDNGLGQNSSSGKKAISPRQDHE